MQQDFSSVVFRMLVIVLGMILFSQEIRAFHAPPRVMRNSVGLRVVKGIQEYDSAFTLPDEVDKQLKELLTHPEMLGEVARQCKCERVEFTGELFQPVPYTMKATRGMPIEIEEKYYSKAYDVSVKMAQLTTNFNQYVVCNVPPTVMFKAKVFKPSRLCAVYQMFDLSPEGRAAIADRVSKTSVSSSEPAAPPPSTDATPWTNIGSTLREKFEEELELDDSELDDMVV